MEKCRTVIEIDDDVWGHCGRDATGTRIYSPIGYPEINLELCYCVEHVLWYDESIGKGEGHDRREDD